MRNFVPVSGFDMPRFAGVPTFMRLPHIDMDHPDFADVQIAMFGVPWDGGTTNRPGPRHGPRQLRDLSTMIRAMNAATGVKPFELVRCADIGDSPINPADLNDALKRVTDFASKVVDHKKVTMAAGGDHLISLPLLRAHGRNGPVGMVHFDAHTDLFKSYFGGYQYTHGTPFRRAIEEGVLDPKRTIQIGIRGTAYDSEDMDFGRSVGVTIIQIEEYVDRGWRDVMAQAREIIGDQPTYVSFDIDVLDPAFAPGTGTPEIGGIDPLSAQRMIRALDGAHLIGADLVEVSPPFDESGGTAWVGANMIFELLCVLARSIDAGHGQ